MRTAVALAVSYLTFATLSAAEFAAAAIKKDTDIPAQSLGSALEAFARDRSLQFIYATTEVETLRTSGVSGNLSANEALSGLLQGTGLSYRFLDEKTVTVQPASLAPRDGVGMIQDATTSSSDAMLIQNRLRLAQADEHTSVPADAESAGNGGSVNPTAERTELEEIVVTAQRREEKLQDVPIAISVFSGKQLDMSSEVSVNNMLFAVPGLNLTTETIGGVARISIRGVNSLLGSNTVGYYVDGVPFGFVDRNFSPDPGAFDLDRVEVLRGPQGTLYGANSLNGVVRVLTKDADLDSYELKGRTLASSIEGGGYNYGADAVGNAPIIPGKLAVRLLLNYDHKGGYVDNLVADEINDGEINNIRLKINGQPTEDLSVKLGYWRSRSDLGSLPMSLPGTDFYPGDLNPGKIDKFDVYSGTVNYDFGSFTASNTASYFDYFNQSIVDWSAWSNTGIAAFLDGLFYYEQASKVFTNELSLNSDSDGPWTWSAGAMYRDAEDLITNHWQDFTFAPAQNESTSSAIFGELTRSFADGALELTGGLRYFHDKVHQLDPGPGTYDVTSSFDHISPRVVLTWHPNDDMTVYASYAQGFRSGLNQPANTEALTPGLPPALEDTLDNYEIGSKGGLFDGFLSYEVAAYYMHWSDVKQSLCTQVVVNTVPTCANFYVNTGTANGPGVDVALTLRPSEQLSIGLTGSWNDLHFTDEVFFGPDLLYNDGDRLALSAETTLGGFINYRASLAGTGLEWGFSGSVNYKTAIEDAQISGRVRGDAITDTRLGLEIVRPEAWTLEIFSDNVLNERGVAIPSATPDNFYVTRWSPRTIGAQFSFQF